MANTKKNILIFVLVGFFADATDTIMVSNLPAAKCTALVAALKMGDVLVVPSGGMILTGNGLHAILSHLDMQAAMDEGPAVIDRETGFGTNRTFNFAAFDPVPVEVTRLASDIALNSDERAFLSELAPHLNPSIFNTSTPEERDARRLAQSNVVASLGRNPKLIDISIHTRNDAISLNLGEGRNVSLSSKELGDMRNRYIESLVGRLIVGLNEMAINEKQRVLNPFAGKVLRIFKSDASKKSVYFAEIIDKEGTLRTVQVSDQAIFVSKAGDTFAGEFENFIKHETALFLEALRVSPISAGNKTRSLEEKVSEKSFANSAQKTFEKTRKERGSLGLSGLQNFNPDWANGRRLHYCAIQKTALSKFDKGDVVWGFNEAGNPEPYVVGVDIIPPELLFQMEDNVFSNELTKDHSGLFVIGVR